KNRAVIDRHKLAIVGDVKNRGSVIYVANDYRGISGVRQTALRDRNNVAATAAARRRPRHGSRTAALRGKHLARRARSNRKIEIPSTRGGLRLDRHSSARVALNVQLAGVTAVPKRDLSPGTREGVSTRPRRRYRDIERRGRVRSHERSQDAVDRGKPNLRRRVAGGAAAPAAGRDGEHALAA